MPRRSIISFGGTRNINGPITINGDLTTTGQILAADGTVSLPGYAFASDPDSGMYRIGTNNLGIGVNAAKVLDIATTGLSIVGTLTVGTTAILAADAANILASRNSTNPQEHRVYGTFTDGSNYERLSIRYAAADRYYVVTEQAGTGTARQLAIGTTGSAALTIRTNGTTRWAVDTNGNFMANVDSTYDIGGSGVTRPRDVHIAQNTLIRASAVGTSGVAVLGVGLGTAPSTSPADMIQIFCEDLSAGNATLGLRTETAVAVDVITASTHSLSVRINGTTYKILLST